MPRQVQANDRPKAWSAHDVFTALSDAHASIQHRISAGGRVRLQSARNAGMTGCSAASDNQHMRQSCQRRTYLSHMLRRQPSERRIGAHLDGYTAVVDEHTQRVVCHRVVRHSCYCCRNGRLNHDSHAVAWMLTGDRQSSGWWQSAVPVLARAALCFSVQGRVLLLLLLDRCNGLNDNWRDLRWLRQ